MSYSPGSGGSAERELRGAGDKQLQQRSFTVTNSTLAAPASTTASGVGVGVGAGETNKHADNYAEVQSIEISCFVLSVCDVVLLAEEWFTDASMFRLLQTAEMLMPRLTANLQAPSTTGLLNLLNPMATLATSAGLTSASTALTNVSNSTTIEAASSEVQLDNRPHLSKYQLNESFKIVDFLFCLFVSSRCLSLRVEQDERGAGRARPASHEALHRLAHERLEAHLLGLHSQHARPSRASEPRTQQALHSAQTTTTHRRRQLARHTRHVDIVEQATAATAAAANEHKHE